MIILPLHNEYLPPLMIMLGLCWIFEHYSGFEEMVRTRSKHLTLFFSFLIFYLWQITSLLYSRDQSMGWSNVFGRLSIFVFPLIFFNPVEKIRANVFKLLKIFAISTSVYTLSCFGYALFRSLSFKTGIWVYNPHPTDSEWLNYFYGPEFTYSIHPTYLAMFVLISVFISFESWYNPSEMSKFSYLWIIMGVFLLASIYFISSRSAILASIIMIIVYSVNKIITDSNSRLFWIVSVLIMLISLPLIRNNDRVNITLSRFSREKLNLNRQDERIIVWESAWKLIKRNPLLGVGIGDVRVDLTQEYLRAGEDKLAKERLNAHNQFLEVLLEGGVIGFSIFLSVLGFMIFIAISEKNLLYGLFILMMLFFFMFETILVRFAGVAFFSLFSFILLNLTSKSHIR